MSNDVIKLFSTVKPSLLRNTLLKGSFVAICGMLLLVYFGLFVPSSSLQLWGIPIVIIGVVLIALGLLPYRRLTQLESSPSEIVVDGHFLQYYSLGKQRYSIPIAMIEKSDYLEVKNDYGIALWLNSDQDQKVIVHDPSFDMARWQRRSRNKYGCDLFIPYFGRRAYTRLAVLDS